MLITNDTSKRTADLFNAEELDEVLGFSLDHLRVSKENPVGQVWVFFVLEVGSFQKPGGSHHRFCVLCEFPFDECCAGARGGN